MYVNKLELNLPIDEAMFRLSNVLYEEGLSVVSDINIQRIMMDSFKESFRPYRILGVCAPGLARLLIGVDSAIGVLLPCNIVVQECGGRTQIDFVDPAAVLSLAGQPAIDDLACQWSRVLEQVRVRLLG
jgi:uncharacterized protein (DUF302 family)